MVSGQRMMTSYFRIGGLALEPPTGWTDRVQKVLQSFPARIDEYEDLLTKNRIWLARTQGVGMLNAADAIALGVSGPSLRGSGVDYDVRKYFPYSSYEEFDFQVPVRTEGDCYARYLCRVAEMRESLKIVKQALEKIPPEGPIKADAPGIVPPQREKMKTEMEALIYHFKIFTEGFAPPPGEVYQRVESPRGELGCFIASDGSPKPYRMKIRAPSFVESAGLAENGGRPPDRRRDRVHRHARHRARGDRSLMNLPPQLETKFQTLENRYPVKRSALIPMLMYAQDQFGYVSDDMIGEIARRLRPQHLAGHRNDGVLLDVAPPSRRKISRAGLHERVLHAARRQ